MGRFISGNLGNFEGQCPSRLLSDTIPDRLEAVDALRPEDTAALAAYVADQRRGQMGRPDDPTGVR